MYGRPGGRVNGGRLRNPVVERSSRDLERSSSRTYARAMTTVSADDLRRIVSGYADVPELSFSLRAEAYVDPHWLAVDREAIFRRSWQWICHVGALREP